VSANSQEIGAVARWTRGWRGPLVYGGVALACYHLPVGNVRFESAVLEALHLAKWYAREHVVLCLIPAFFIAGAIGVFVRQAAVIRYLGARANKGLAYGVASVSGSVLAVCSCTVLPLFAGIYRMGAGLGPACAFLYSGPAINVLAVILTARVLGLRLGIARAVGAVLFSLLIGLAMHVIFRREELARAEAQAVLPESEEKRPLWQNATHFAVLVSILVFANWAEPAHPGGLWHAVHAVKWRIVAGASLALALILGGWFRVKWRDVLLGALPAVCLAFVFPARPVLAFVAGVVGLCVVLARSGGEPADWLAATWGFARQILPLLLIGVLVAGLLLGRPDHEGLIPSRWIARLVGGNSLRANLFASVAGALMYFATLTEVPILQGLIGNGMGQGPALALLLAGPALSLPNILVIRSVIGTKKTLVFVALVVVMATIAGMTFGAITAE